MIEIRGVEQQGSNVSFQLLPCNQSVYMSKVMANVGKETLQMTSECIEKHTKAGRHADPNV